MHLPVKQQENMRHTARAAFMKRLQSNPACFVPLLECMVQVKSLNRTFQLRPELLRRRTDGGPTHRPTRRLTHHFIARDRAARPSSSRSPTPRPRKWTRQRSIRLTLIHPSTRTNFSSTITRCGPRGTGYLLGPALKKNNRRRTAPAACRPPQTRPPSARTNLQVTLCPKRFKHDWIECMYAHVGESACRRDPRTHHYGAAPCNSIKDVGHQLRPRCPCPILPESKAPHAPRKRNDELQPDVRPGCLGTCVHTQPALCAEAYLC
jgi:hypothetical protein